MSRLIAPILLFIVSAGLFFTYLKPAYNVYLAFKEQEKRLDVAIGDSKDLLKKYDELYGKYSLITDAQKQKLDKILPDSVDVVHLVMDLDNLSTNHNLSINSFDIPDMESGQTPTRSKNRRNITNKDKDSSIGEAVLGLDIEGDYKDFKSFLYDVEKSLSLMDAVSLEIDVPDVDMLQPGVERKVSYSLKLQVYWLK